MSLENYSLLKKLILEEILDNSSTIEISKELGYKIDQYKRWLNEEKIFRWDDFELLCEKKGVKLQEALGKVVPITIYSNEKNVFAILRQWSLLETNGEVAEYLNCHVSVIKRYNQGKTVPDLETILKMLDVKSNQLQAFINSLFERIKNLQLKELVKSDEHFHTDILKNPLIPVIDSIVGIESYKKRSISSAEWIAEQIKEPVEKVQKTLSKMLALEVLSLETNTDTYVSTKKVTNLEGATFQDHIQGIQYLISKGNEGLDKRKDPKFVPPYFGGATTYSVFGMSVDTIKKVNDIIFQAQNEIHQLMENQTGPEVEVRAILLQTFGLAK
ncbi:MAG: helix-turn-helix transcriptional regulator [Bdellovibrionales bacterium]|nr:helix-turn-helix transcriptional regulator [Bdellovibrionales bacterium]